MNKDIQQFEDQVDQLRVKTRAKLQQNVVDLQADLSQLILDHQQDIEPLQRQIRELQTTLRAKKNDHKSRRKLAEKKMEAAQKDLDGFGETTGDYRTSPTLDKEFECLVCLGIMGPPRQIFQCPNGHLICGVCKTNTHGINCHICRVHLGGGYTRSLAMERVIRAYLGENSK